MQAGRQSPARSRSIGIDNRQHVPENMGPSANGPQLLAKSRSVRSQHQHVSSNAGWSARVVPGRPVRSDNQHVPENVKLPAPMEAGQSPVACEGPVRGSDNHHACKDVMPSALVALGPPVMCRSGSGLDCSKRDGCRAYAKHLGVGASAMKFSDAFTSTSTSARGNVAPACQVP